MHATTFYCSKCGEVVVMDFHTFHFEHDRSRPGPDCAGGPVMNEPPKHPVILGEVISSSDEPLLRPVSVAGELR